MLVVQLQKKIFSKCGTISDFSLGSEQERKLWCHCNAIFVRTGDGKVPVKIEEGFRKVEKKVFTAYTKSHAVIRDYSIFLCYDFRGLKEEKSGSY